MLDKIKFLSDSMIFTTVFNWSKEVYYYKRYDSNPAYYITQNIIINMISIHNEY